MTVTTDTTEKPPAEKLLDALDKLTKAQTVANWQGEELIRRTDPPLLDWLRELIVSDMGGNGGSGKSARERTPIDVGAFTLYEGIEGRVRAWVNDMGGKPGKDLTPAQVLRSWYVLWNAGNPSENLTRSYLAILEGWVQAIEDVLDPPKRIEITAPCPVCGNEWINVGLKLADGSDDPNDMERVHVLIAVERESIHESFAMCRSCDRVWTGTGEMRLLRIAIDDAETAKLEGLSA